MIKCNADLESDHQQRLKIKTLEQQLANHAVSGAGISPWEARVLVDIVHDIFFSDPDIVPTMSSGQMKYTCVAVSEPAGKPLEKCRMVNVILTYLSSEDHERDGQALDSASVRRRRIARLTDEAYEQGGLLSQEDLAEILQSDIRTVRRDTAALKSEGLAVPTRGTVKDIGPGITHKELAVRHWLDGKEPMEVARVIHHSLKATENYLEKFKRIAYLVRKGFTDCEMARVVGISLAAVSTFKRLYEEFKNKRLFKNRMEEIEIAGSQYMNSEGEKKSFCVSSPLKNEQ